jgi:hypothetical protein
MEAIACNQTNMNVNVLLLMAIAGAIAAIGIATNALPERDLRYPSGTPRANAAGLRDRDRACC